MLLAKIKMISLTTTYYSLAEKGGSCDEKGRRKGADFDDSIFGSAVYCSFCFGFLYIEELKRT